MAQDVSPPVWAAGLLAKVESLSAEVASLRAARRKELIWSGQFVDFATLLPNFKADSGDLHLRQANGSIYLAPVWKSQPLSITQWISAFFTFMTVYVAKNPEASVPQILANRAGDCTKGWGLPQVR